MKFQFKHPAIVYSDPDGNYGDRKALVSIETEIEISEYVETDIKPSFEVDLPTYKGKIFTIDGKHYKEYRDHFVEKHKFPESLYVKMMMNFQGRVLPFLPFSLMMIEELKDFYGLENASKKPTKQEETSYRGITNFDKAILKAPALKNWRWLSRSTDATLEYWREKAREQISNVIMIGGNTYVRCFEPCLKLYFSNNKATISGGVADEYQRQVHKPEINPHGDIWRGGGYYSSNSFLFSANDFDEASDLANAMEWELTRLNEHSITVLDENASQLNYGREEVVRYAGIAAAEVSQFVEIATWPSFQEHESFVRNNVLIEEAKRTINDGLLSFANGQCDINELDNCRFNTNQILDNIEIDHLSQGLRNRVDNYRICSVAMDKRQDFTNITVSGLNANIKAI